MWTLNCVKYILNYMLHFSLNIIPGFLYHVSKPRFYQLFNVLGRDFTDYMISVTNVYCWTLGLF